MEKQEFSFDDLTLQVKDKYHEQHNEVMNSEAEVTRPSDELEKTQRRLRTLEEHGQEYDQMRRTGAAMARL